MKTASDAYMEYLRLYELGRMREASSKLDEAVRAHDPLALHTRAYEAEESNPPRIAEALKLYKLAAEQGYEPSVMNLARYYEGCRNPKWYLYWLRKAADMGSPDAKQELERPFPYLVSQAVLDLEANGSIESAESAFRLAARHGNVDAMVNLANLYDLKFKPPRTATAEKLYKEAAKRGNEIAKNNLNRHYEDLEIKKKYIRHSECAFRLLDKDRFE